MLGYCFFVCENFDENDQNIPIFAKNTTQSACYSNDRWSHHGPLYVINDSPNVNEWLQPRYSKLCRIKRFCPENVFVIGPAIFDTFENHCIVQLVSVADGELLLMRIIDIEVNITAEVTVEIYSNTYSKGSIMTNENIYKWLNIFYSTTFKTGRESLWI